MKQQNTKYKKQTGIAFIIAEKEDGTYDVNMGSNSNLPQDGLPVKLAMNIIDAVNNEVEKYTRMKKEKSTTIKQ